jgi:WD40 repeat protein
VCDTDFSADGKSLVSAGDDRALIIWKLKVCNRPRSRRVGEMLAGFCGT